MASRLSKALQSGAVAVAPGPVVVFRPTAETDLSLLPKEDVQIVQGFKPDHDAWAARGYDTQVVVSGDFASAIVIVPRAKAEARGLIAEAMAATGGGPVIVDGQKTDGIESLLKEARACGAVGEPMSAAHGKVFAIFSGDFSDWAAAPVAVDGFQTAPGVFSADGIDPASAALAEALPKSLPKTVADLGAGWGYLAARVLERPGVESLHLVEADHAALDCARVNIRDPRAQFHWADARRFAPPEPLDAVVMNPPFHQARAADPGLGQAFIQAAAGMLKSSGRLWLVANRHLPYESAMRSLFREVEEIGGDGRFKLLSAAKPTRRARA